MKAHLKPFYLKIGSLFFLILGFTCQVKAQQKISLEFLPGGAVTAPSLLLVKQKGYPDIRQKAHYKTNSFRLPVYYSWRITYAFEPQRSFSVEFNHLKIFLVNPVETIDQFSISHGYNQVWFNYEFHKELLTLRSGIGPVIAHPENTIRGKYFSQDQGLFNKGYYISGLTAQAAVQFRYFIGRHFFLSTEGKLVASYSVVPVVDGKAHVPLYSINGLAGIGFAF